MRCCSLVHDAQFLELLDGICEIASGSGEKR